MDMRFVTWNVSRLYRTGSLKALSSELQKYKAVLVAVQNVRWNKGGSQPADDYTFFYGNGKASLHLRTGFFVHMGIISAVKMVEFIGDRISYIPKSLLV